MDGSSNKELLCQDLNRHYVSHHVASSIVCIKLMNDLKMPVTVIGYSRDSSEIKMSTLLEMKEPFQQILRNYYPLQNELDVKHHQPLSIMTSIPVCCSSAKTSPDYDLDYSVTFLEETEEEELDSIFLETSSILSSLEAASISSSEWDEPDSVCDRSSDELDAKHYVPQRLINCMLYTSSVMGYDELDVKHYTPKHSLNIIAPHKRTHATMIEEHVDPLDVKHYYPMHSIQATKRTRDFHSKDDELDRKHYQPIHTLHCMIQHHNEDAPSYEKDELDERHYAPIHLLKPASKICVAPPALQPITAKTLSLSENKPEDREVEDIATPRETWQFDENNAFLPMGTLSYSEADGGRNLLPLSTNVSCASFLNTVNENDEDEWVDTKKVVKESIAMSSPSKSLPQIPKLSFTSLLSPQPSKEEKMTKNSIPALLTKLPLDRIIDFAGTEEESDEDSDTARDTGCAISREHTSEEVANGQLTDRFVSEKIPLPVVVVRGKKEVAAVLQPSNNKKEKMKNVTLKQGNGCAEWMHNKNIRDENQENYCACH